MRRGIKLKFLIDNINFRFYEQRIRKKLEQSRKRREKIPEPVVTRLVDREDPWFTPSYHEQMQELAKKDYQRRHGYKPDDVIF